MIRHRPFPHRRQTEEEEEEDLRWPEEITTTTAKTKSLAAELANAVEVAVCVNAAVDTFSFPPSSSSSSAALAKGAFYFDEYGFSVPPVMTELSDRNCFLLRRTWLHLRQVSCTVLLSLLSPLSPLFQLSPLCLHYLHCLH